MTIQITDRQIEIIEAAGKILSRSGVSGLTIKNLAKEMKFSESAIYRHFKSKEDIIVAMLEYLAESINDLHRNTLADDAPADERLERLFQKHFSFFSKNPHYVAVVFSDGLLEVSKKINETILKIMEVKMKYLLPIILEGQKSGVFTNAVATDELLNIIMGAVRLEMFKWRMDHYQFDLQKYGNEMIQSLLILIKK